MNNACVKFEERSLNPSKIIALTTKLGRGGGGVCVADENIISPKTYVSREYNYPFHSMILSLKQQIQILGNYPISLGTDHAPNFHPDFQNINFL